MTFHEFDEHDDAIRSTLAELTRRFALGTPIEDTLAGVTAAAVNLIRAADGIVKLFENTCGSVDVSGLCGGT